MSKFWIKNKGACEQYAIALAMLCYNDPDIDCVQMPVEFVPEEQSEGLPKWYKHSANYIRIRQYKDIDESAIGYEGIVDILNSGGIVIPYNEFMDEQINIPAGHGRITKVLGMAYYERGHKLEDIYMDMQRQGLGIKFDFDKYEPNKEGRGFDESRKAFEQSYNQKQLAKTVERQGEEAQWKNL
jgi:hypothetical protein